MLYLLTFGRFLGLSIFKGAIELKIGYFSINFQCLYTSSYAVEQTRDLD